jgi:hypothetical protein
VPFLRSGGLSRELRMPNSWEMSKPQDCSRINVDQPHELSWWTRKWDVTPAQLRDAVERVGPSCNAVARELGKEI